MRKLKFIMMALFVSVMFIFTTQTNSVSAADVTFPLNNYDIIDISTGYVHSIVAASLKTNSDSFLIMTSGQGSEGQLGNNTSYSDYRVNITSRFTLSASVRPTKVSASNSTTMLLASNSDTYVWGDGQLVPFKNTLTNFTTNFNKFKESGSYYYNTGRSYAPDQSSTLGTIVEIAAFGDLIAGGYTAVTSTGWVFTWTYSDWTKIGREKMTAADITTYQIAGMVAYNTPGIAIMPVLNSGEKVVKAFPGSTPAYLTNQNRVITLASNGTSFVVNNISTANFAAGETITKFVRSFDANYQHTLLLTNLGNLYGFGKNTVGQLPGLVNGLTVPTKLDLSFLQPGETVVDVAAGTGVTSFVTSLGRVFNSGAGTYGANGNKVPNQNQTTFLDITLDFFDYLDYKLVNNVPSLDQVERVLGNGYYFMYFTRDGRYFAIGNNVNGQFFDSPDGVSGVGGTNTVYNNLFAGYIPKPAIHYIVNSYTQLAPNLSVLVDSDNGYNTGEIVTAPSYTDAPRGFKVAGWSQRPTMTPLDMSNYAFPSSRVNVQVNLELIEVPLYFQPNGGSYITEPVSTYNIESTTITMPEVERQGYNFAGWYIDGIFDGDHYVGNQYVSYDINSLEPYTFVALWEEAGYQVDYYWLDNDDYDSISLQNDFQQKTLTLAEVNYYDNFKLVDITRDGYEDLFVFYHGNLVDIYIQTADLNFDYYQTVTLPFNYYENNNGNSFANIFFFEDMNGDGLRDMVFRSVVQPLAKVQFFIMYQNADGSFDPLTTVDIAINGVAADVVQFYDIDGDGSRDILYTFRGDTLGYVLNGFGSWSEKWFLQFHETSQFTYMTVATDYFSNTDGSEFRIIISNGTEKYEYVYNNDLVLQANPDVYLSGSAQMTYFTTFFDNYLEVAKLGTDYIDTYQAYWDFEWDLYDGMEFGTFQYFDTAFNPFYSTIDYLITTDGEVIIFEPDGGYTYLNDTVATTDYYLDSQYLRGLDGELYVVAYNDTTMTIDVIWENSFSNPAWSSPMNVSETAYTFDGWFYDDSFTNAFVPGSIVSGDFNLYGKLTPTEYTPTFNYNGGTIGANTQIVSYNIEDDLQPVEPTKVGYTFTGWLDQNGQPITLGTGNYEITEFNAQWEINQYTITFNANGGSQIDPITLDYGTAVTTPANPSREGYTFTGWDQAIPATMPAEDLTITPAYNINSYTITFNSNGGSTVSDLTDFYSVSLNAPEDPTKEGYTFRGWFTDSQLTSQYTFTTMPATNQTLYAKWSINTYTVTVQNWDETTMQYDEFDYATDLSSYTLPQGFSRTGYTFAGWDTVVPSTMPAEDLTITALWTVNQYNLNFNTDGGSAIDSVRQDYDSSLSLPDEPTKEGYTFTGWLYLNDDEDYVALDIDAMPARDLTLEASWSINTYSLTIENYDGTTLQYDEFDYATDLSSYTLPAEPTREGYTFDGWDIVVPSTMPAEDLTITAVFYDSAAPVVTASYQTLTLEYGDTFTAPVVTVTDNVDQNLTYTTDSNLDVTTVGTYTITYYAVDAYGNVSNTVTVTITVVDTTNPTLEFNIDQIVINHGQSLDQALDEVLTANDNYASIEVTSGDVKLTSPGTYELEVVVTDVNGNQVSGTIEVVVKPVILPYIIIGVLGAIGVAAVVVLKKRG